MKKILIINAHPYGKNTRSSRTLKLGEKFCSSLEKTGEFKCDWLNLYEEDIPNVNDQMHDYYISRQQGKFDFPITIELEEMRKKRWKLIKEFMSYDNFVFIYPMYALSYPAALKNYIDNIVVPPFTYYYNEDDHIVGRILNKKAFIISAGTIEWQKGEFQDYISKRIVNWDDHGRKQLESCLQMIGFNYDDIDYVMIDKIYKDYLENLDSDDNKLMDKINEVIKKWS